MAHTPPELDFHLFICTNRKDEGKASCAPKGAEALRDRVKSEAARLSERYPGKKFRVNASGCLGQCAQGIAAVCYPGTGRWFTELGNDLESEQKLVAAIEEGLTSANRPQAPKES